MIGEKTEELGPEQWQKMLEHDGQQEDANNAMNSPLGLTEETKGNLAFMLATLAAILLFGFLGGWYYLT